MRLKDIAYINRRVLPETTDPDFSFKYIDISSVNGLGTIEIPDRIARFGDAPSRARRIAPTGSTVVSTVRTYLRAIAQVPPANQNLVFSTGFAVLEAKPNADSRFLAYVCRSQPLINEVVARSTGVSYPAINPGDLASIEVLVPSLDRQRRIADFLDAEMARIDRLAALQHSVLTKLDQRDRAVRDSLIDRLADKVGELPLRRYSTRIEQGSSPLCENHPREPGEWGVLKLSAIKQGRFLPDENKQLPGDVEPMPEYEVHDGDLLVTRANTPDLVGDVAVASGAGQRLLLPDLIYRVGLEREISANFVAQVLLSSRVRSLIQATARGSSQSMVKLRGEDIREWPVPRADAEQQAEVVAAIDDQLRASDKLRAAINRQLTLLAERRQALITAAVTGGITV